MRADKAPCPTNKMNDEEASDSVDPATLQSSYADDRSNEGDGSWQRHCHSQHLGDIRRAPARGNVPPFNGFETWRADGLAGDFDATADGLAADPGAPWVRALCDVVEAVVQANNTSMMSCFS